MKSFDLNIQLKNISQVKSYSRSSRKDKLQDKLLRVNSNIEANANYDSNFDMNPPVSDKYKRFKKTGISFTKA